MKNTNFAVLLSCDQVRVLQPLPRHIPDNCFICPIVSRKRTLCRSVNSFA